jgi:uncharacterized membrane protein
MSSKTNNRRAPSNGKQEDPTVESNVIKVSEIEERERKQRSLGEKIAELIAAFCGSMVFVYVHVVWFGAWIVINSMIPNLAFDPFPYTFLTLVVSLEAIFLSTFILISQNHETRLTERRNHLDLQINMLAEQESTKTLDLLRKMATQMGVPCDDVDELTKPVEPAELIEKISSAADEGSPVGK